MLKGLPVPDKTYRWGSWRCMIYKQKQTAILLRSDGKTYMIKPDTEQLAHVPKYIQSRLYRIGFLTQWREEQLRRTANRLKELANRHDRFLKSISQT